MESLPFSDGVLIEDFHVTRNLAIKGREMKNLSSLAESFTLCGEEMLSELLMIVVRGRT